MIALQETIGETKGSSESVNRRNIHNIMAYRKMTEGKTTIYKTSHALLRNQVYKKEHFA